MRSLVSLPCLAVSLRRSAGSRRPKSGAFSTVPRASGPSAARRSPAAGSGSAAGALGAPSATGASGAGGVIPLASRRASICAPSPSARACSSVSSAAAARDSSRPPVRSFAGRMPTAASAAMRTSRSAWTSTIRWSAAVVVIRSIEAAEASDDCSDVLKPKLGTRPPSSHVESDGSPAPPSISEVVTKRPASLPPTVWWPPVSHCSVAGPSSTSTTEGSTTWKRLPTAPVSVPALRSYRRSSAIQALFVPRARPAGRVSALNRSSIHSAGSRPGVVNTSSPPAASVSSSCASWRISAPSPTTSSASHFLNARLPGAGAAQAGSYMVLIPRSSGTGMVRVSAGMCGRCTSEGARVSAVGVVSRTGTGSTASGRTPVPVPVPVRASVVTSGLWRPGSPGVEYRRQVLGRLTEVTSTSNASTES